MNPTFVLDCSITMAWCFADEVSPIAARVQDRLESERALVPSLWFLEITNVLALAEKRKRIAAPDSDRFLALLTALDIVADSDTSSRAFDHLLKLCRDHGVTSYDAAYLDLAIRRGLPLATLDADMKRTAKRLRIELVA